MNSVADAIRDSLARHQVRDTKVLAAVSGGADSVAMLLSLVQLENESELKLSVGHFDHQLRATSGEDAEWVKSLCEQLGIPVAMGCPDDIPEITSTGSVEEVARTKRYAWLQMQAESVGAKWIAVAHTADDQVETVLHHLFRGTGIRGLQGIPETRKLSEEVSILRPLMNVRRCDLDRLLKECGQAVRNDESNEDRKFTRNRMRHDVIPLLKENFNPQLEEAILRLSVQATRAQQALNELAAVLLKEATVERDEARVRLSQTRLKLAPEGLIAEVFIHLWQQEDWPRQGMKQTHWNQLVSMVTKSDPRGLSLPGEIQARLRKKVIQIGHERSIEGNLKP